MTSSIIVLLELGLLSLLLFLVFRVFSLNRSEPLVSSSSAQDPDIHIPVVTTDDQPQFRVSVPGGSKLTTKSSSHLHDKSRLLSQLHILACLQDRDCKEQGLELDSAHDTVRGYAVCWLYGAACAISPAGQNSDALAILVSQFAARKMGMKQSDALGAISTLTRQPAALVCFRMGVKGTEFWKQNRYVPRDKSLFEAVTSNTLV